jgi:hypothetical protein
LWPATPPGERGKRPGLKTTVETNMRNWTGTILTLSLFASAAQAHHSLSNYDQGRDVRADGVVEEFHFVNPHPVLMIAVTDPAGVRQVWRLEMDNLHELDEIGISRTTFKPGDRVTISGNPDRTEPREIYLRRLDRPSDGLHYEQIGSRPQLTHTRGPG